ncbi:sterol desaturase family protein [Aquiflexum sp. TKW24L]|uniref:sterol desaturase family protein n=1 Tax=Aquiflexum sp. TKW24L TaxID=2942212 RepID=UPI0020C17840|nr:sterol desaturase family protein [Aquiflexum sp. TKW24L]MCL6259390.1 sterol desaturase family protein [Aquiflexum sp. TKW24L]
METLESLLSIDLNYIVIGLIALFFTLEQILNPQFPFQRRGYHFWNSFLFQVVFLIGNVFWAIVFVFCIEWLNQNEIGLFYMIDLPIWLKLVLGVMILDFATYWFHRFSHLSPLLWRFHRVHHSDTTMDSSTYFRGHPMEVLFWFGSAPILMSALFGLDLFIIGVYVLILTPFLVLEHSNLRFPAWLDKTAGLIFTTPNLHKIHHDQDQYYTDSNFSDIFILWDRIFGTFKYKPVDQVKFGLEEFDEPKKQTFWYLLRAPFLTIERKVK